MAVGGGGCATDCRLEGDPGRLRHRRTAQLQGAWRVPLGRAGGLYNHTVFVEGDGRYMYYEAGGDGRALLSVRVSYLWLARRKRGVATGHSGTGRWRHAGAWRARHGGNGARIASAVDVFALTPLSRTAFFHGPDVPSPTPPRDTTPVPGLPRTDVRARRRTGGGGGAPSRSAEVNLRPRWRGARTPRLHLAYTWSR